LSKTTRKPINKNDEQISKLKNKLNDQKQEILRLKRLVRELKKRLEAKGKKQNVPELEKKEEPIKDTSSNDKYCLTRQELTNRKKEFMKKFKSNQ
jgi:predicted RNase H-like nuclease (RuvC/YqgF family)